jgi:hypothetical protein
MGVGRCRTAVKAIDAPLLTLARFRLLVQGRRPEPFRTNADEKRWAGLCTYDTFEEGQDGAAGGPEGLTTRPRGNTGEGILRSHAQACGAGCGWVDRMSVRRAVGARSAGLLFGTAGERPGLALRRHPPLPYRAAPCRTVGKHGRRSCVAARLRTLGGGDGRLCSGVRVCLKT